MAVWGVIAPGWLRSVEFAGVTVYVGLWFACQNGFYGCDALDFSLADCKSCFAVYRITKNVFLYVLFFRVKHISDYNGHVGKQKEGIKLSQLAHQQTRQQSAMATTRTPRHCF